MVFDSSTYGVLITPLKWIAECTNNYNNHQAFELLCQQINL